MQATTTTTGILEDFVLGTCQWNKMFTIAPDNLRSVLENIAYFQLYFYSK